MNKQQESLILAGLQNQSSFVKIDTRNEVTIFDNKSKFIHSYDSNAAAHQRTTLPKISSPFHMKHRSQAVTPSDNSSDG